MDMMIGIFKKRVLEILEEAGVRFIIFGSRGRGDASEYSDYDLLIITSQDSSHLEEKIEAVEMDMFYQHSVIINSHLFSREEINRLKFEPFIMNALREGVAA
jgi:predicted nucleotidyltransferase